MSKKNISTLDSLVFLGGLNLTLILPEVGGVKYCTGEGGCGKAVKRFRNKEAEREYGFSQLCNSCQFNIFGEG